MRLHNQIAQFAEEMTAWRRTLHAAPELAFEEHKTSQFVADRLREFGVDEIHRNIAGTGIVAVIRAGSSDRAIGIRADMDALPMQEEGTPEYRSAVDGRMHACGHDGHTTMLLGAARYLAETRNFDGTAYLIFQPAEEIAGGALAMIQDGLFQRFPMQSVYALHNWPGMPAGQFAFKAGPIMAGVDSFDIEVTGRGAHGAQPHKGIDPVLTAAHIATGLQTIVSRIADPSEALVVSVTSIRSGGAHNIIPERALLGGTIRSLTPASRAAARAALEKIAAGIAETFGATASVAWGDNTAPTVNHAAETELARQVAIDLVGADRVQDLAVSNMTGEDFSSMLEALPGSFVLLGNGTEGPNGRGLHNAQYDFNDAVLPVGASYWSRLVETLLPQK